jgi:hypothetical protein
MAQTNFGDMPDRMNKWKEQLLSDRAAKQKELDEIDNDLRRVEAFFNPPAAQATVAPAEHRPRAPSTRARTPEGQYPPLWNHILSVLKRYDKAEARVFYDELRSVAQESSINNALPKMKEAGLITQPGGRRTPYFLAPSHKEPEAPAPAAAEQPSAEQPEPVVEETPETAPEEEPEPALAGEEEATKGAEPERASPWYRR